MGERYGVARDQHLCDSAPITMCAQSAAGPRLLEDKGWDTHKQIGVGIVVILALCGFRLVPFIFLGTTAAPLSICILT